MTVLKFIGMLALVLLAWTGVLIGLSFAAAPGRPLAAVTLPGRGLDVVARAGGSYESFGGPLTITRSGEAGFVRRLYAAGALLVIDARVVSACRSRVATPDGRN
jgi:hypothetical protein